MDKKGRQRGEKEDNQTLNKPKLAENASQQSNKQANENKGTQSAPTKFMASAQKAYQNLAPKIQMAINQKGKAKVVEEEEEEESEDEGLKMGDLITPGCDVLNVGPSEPVGEDRDNDRMLWKMDCNTSHTVVINEYGSNIFKSKFDPLQLRQKQLFILQERVNAGI